MSRGMGHTARAFATAFADRDQIEPYCWSVNELADLAGITPRAARMTVGVLVRRGVIRCFSQSSRPHEDYEAVPSQVGHWNTYPTMPHERGRGPYYCMASEAERDRSDRQEREAAAQLGILMKAFGL